LRIVPDYQPIYDLTTRRIFGYEALARGSGGEKPAEIFYQANRDKQLKEVDLLCIKAAVANAPSDTNLFVNIFPPTLMWAVSTGALNAIPRDGIFLEIVEATKSTDIFGGLLDAVDKLRNIGYGIVIDDISSGYDRLRMLAEMRPHFVKIDRPLICDCHKNKSRRNVIHRLFQMAVDNEAQVVAEGIEKPDELLTLDDIGIRYGQGFLLGYPERRPWENKRKVGAAVV